MLHALTLAAAMSARGVDLRVLRAAATVRYVHVVSDVVVDGVAGRETLIVDLRRGRYADRVDAGPLSSGEGFDGANAWVSDASQMAAVQGNADARGAILTAARLLSGTGARIDAVTPLLSRPGTLTIRLRLHGVSRAVDVARDAGGALVRVTTRIGPDESTSEFSQYRTIGGVTLPLLTVTFSRAGRETSTVRAVTTLPTVAGDAFAPPAEPHDGRADGIVVVPLEYRLGCPLVSVRINGGPPLRMLLDTGASSGITPAAARRLGLHAVGHARALGFGPGSVALAFTRVARVRVGAAELRDQVFSVLDDSDDFGADGTIGYELFARFAVRIDPRRKRLELARDVRALRPRGARVAMTFDGIQPQVAGAVDALRGALTIDTGSSFGADVMRPFVRRYDLCRRLHSTRMVLGGGVGGSNAGCAASARRVRIGPVVTPGVGLSLAVAPGNGFDDPSVLANVGSALLNRYVVVYDYRRASLWFAPR